RACCPAALTLFSLECHGDPPHLHSFPTRRSSDLAAAGVSAWIPSDSPRGGLPKWLTGSATPQNMRIVPIPAAKSMPNHVRLECRSEEHTSELQSRFDLVCRLLLEKKKNNNVDQQH